MKRAECVILVFGLISFTKGCHHNRQDAGTDGEIRRTTRSVKGPDVRQDMSDFFTECMIRKAQPGLIPVMRAAVDFSMRDTIWYKASDSYFCEGTKDTLDCWQGIMDLLIDWDSKLLGPARECVLEYSTQTRTGGYKQRREIRNYDGENAEDGPHCPGVSDSVYGDCIIEEVNDTVTYPSLERFHWESIAIFLREHVSRCRIEEFSEPWNGGRIAYRRNCGHSRYKGPSGERVQSAKEQCVPFILLEVIKEESPLKPEAEICNERFSNYSVVDIVPDSESPLTELEVPLDTDTEFKTYGRLGMHSGADIVGYCDPKSRFTRWYDNFNPNGTGDKELLRELRVSYPGEICHQPQGVQIRVSRNSQPYYTSGNNFAAMSPNVGVECKDSMQHNGKTCENFKVRFCCYENPHQNVVHNHPYAKTQDTVGTCGSSDRWGPWKNIDRKQGDGGDFEYFSQYGQSGCDPVAVQGRIYGTDSPYTHARNNLRTEDPKTGIVCSSDMQPKERPCRDLEVRFCCKDGKGADDYLNTWASFNNVH